MARKKETFPKQIMVCKEQDRDNTYLVAAETTDELPEEAKIVGIYDLRTTATITRKVEVKIKGG